MKKIVFNFILVFAFFSYSQALYSQAQKENQAEAVEEEIELPDVTTVINGKTFTAGKDSVPDYTKILPENSAPEVQLPEMEGVKIPKNLPENIERSVQKEKDIYASGELGAGYPFYFKGDFSIYRASGNSPFEIDFNHESAEGFAREKSNEGYFERSTLVKGKKSLFGEISNHRVQAEYKMTDDGLQLKSDSYSDMVKHTIYADAGSDWDFSNGLLLSYGADGAWFNRYGQVMKDSLVAENFLDSTKILDLNPYAGFGWADYGFKAMFTASYGFQGNLGGEDNLLKIQSSSSDEYSHRGQFKLDLSWENDFMMLGADGAVIVGSAIGEKNVLPAFTAKADFQTDYFTDDRFVTLSLKGGLDSYQAKIRELENKYKFAVSPVIPTETSDWFAKMDLLVPILSAFEVKSEFEFRKTAFENGVWQVKYKEAFPFDADFTSGLANQFGLYAIESVERTEVNTVFAFNADFAPFKAGIEWKSFWKDLPSLEDEQKIALRFEYQSADAKWNAGTSAAFAFGEDADKCPDLSLWTGCRLAPALSLAFEVNDVIKLLGGKSRDYAHSEFITTSGNAVLLVKFHF